jgi:catechol 2,3-dioxygenase-like lactoylglutathione lyase family enzyme
VPYGVNGAQTVASIRYIVTDIDSSVEFYRDRLAFSVDMHNPGKFAALVRDDLTLYLTAPGVGSGGTAGGRPEPGGWNRFMIITTDLDGLIGRLNDAGAKFRGEISEAGAGRARLLEDPSGNLIELFEFKRK